VKRDAIECKYQRRGRVTIKNRSKWESGRM
jgi:hypothetical protein